MLNKRIDLFLNFSMLVSSQTTALQRLVSILRSIKYVCVYEQIDSPVGKLTLMASEQGLHALLWENDFFCKGSSNELVHFKKDVDNRYISLAKVQLSEYFLGERREFSIPLVLEGTEFQKASWRELVGISYAEMISYQDQAIKLGDKNKVRAVGAAIGRNPISIIIPCHRVVAKNGSLHGFAGGLENKKALLDLERSHLNSL